MGKFSISGGFEDIFVNKIESAQFACVFSKTLALLHLRLGEIWKKWSDTICYLSIVILCVNLKNATPILVPHPKNNFPRPS